MKTVYCHDPEPEMWSCDNDDHEQPYSCVFEGTTLKSCTNRMQTDVYCEYNNVGDICNPCTHTSSHSCWHCDLLDGKILYECTDENIVEIVGE